MSDAIEPCPNPECRYDRCRIIRVTEFATSEPLIAVSCPKCNYRGPVTYAHKQDEAMRLHNLICPNSIVRKPATFQDAPRGMSDEMARVWAEGFNACIKTGDSQ